MVNFEHVRTVPLRHNGECGLLGVGPDLDFYVEEIYGEEGWMAQSGYDLEGNLLAEVDEVSGANQGVERLQKPGNLVRPHTGRSDIRLNFGGARHRGLQTEDRIEEMVRPLEMAEKMMLVEEGLVPAIPPPTILGLAQSYVVSEVQLTRPARDTLPLFLLSRRLRIAYRLLEPLVDARGERYDYDSLEVAILQRYTPGDEDLSLGEMMVSKATLGVELNRLNDIILRDGYLFAADSAGERDDVISQVHIWLLTLA